MDMSGKKARFRDFFHKIRLKSPYIEVTLPFPDDIMLGNVNRQE